MKIRFRCAIPCAARVSCLDSIRCTLRMRGSFWRLSLPEYADAAINALSLAPGGSEAQVIGEVREQPAGTVLVTTLYGGSRIVDMLVGDPLPRIC